MSWIVFFQILILFFAFVVGVIAIINATKYER